MNPPTGMVRVYKGLKYETDTSTLIAGDDYWDGNSYERRWRNTFLYRTPNGRYFVVRRTMWQDERDALIPVSKAEAIELYEEALPVHRVKFEEAFPDVKIETA